MELGVGCCPVFTARSAINPENKHKEVIGKVVFFHFPPGNSESKGTGNREAHCNWIIFKAHCK